MYTGRHYDQNAEERFGKSVTSSKATEGKNMKAVRNNLVVDPNGMEWSFVESRCPKCGNRYPRQGKCNFTCKGVDLVPIKPRWELTGEHFDEEEA